MRAGVVVFMAAGGEVEFASGAEVDRVGSESEVDFAAGAEVDRASEVDFEVDRAGSEAEVDFAAEAEVDRGGAEDSKWPAVLRAVILVR